MQSAEIHITTHRGAVAVELMGLTPQLPVSSFSLSGPLAGGDDASALPAAAWAPLRWAVSASLGGLVDPVGWLERARICVRIDETDCARPGQRRFEVALTAQSGETPLAMNGTAEVPRWVVKAARYTLAGALEGRAEAAL